MAVNRDRKSGKYLRVPEQLLLFEAVQDSLGIRSIMVQLSEFDIEMEDFDDEFVNVLEKKRDKHSELFKDEVYACYLGGERPKLRHFPRHQAQWSSSLSMRTNTCRVSST